MAQREAGKARKRAVKANAQVRVAASAARESGPPQLTANQQISQLEQERDALKAELEAAMARIAELEKSRELIANRIDWVIDSLHNLIEK